MKYSLFTAPTWQQQETIKQLKKKSFILHSWNLWKMWNTNTGRAHAISLYMFLSFPPTTLLASPHSLLLFALVHTRKRCTMSLCVKSKQKILVISSVQIIFKELFSISAKLLPHKLPFRLLPDCKSWSWTESTVDLKGFTYLSLITFFTVFITL